jgi:hypothetical protein
LVRAEGAFQHASIVSASGFVDRGVVGSEPSPEQFFQAFSALSRKFLPETRATGDGRLVFTRNPEPKGPLAVFGYDYFEGHAKADGVSTPKLLSYQGLWGAGEEYAYETLNFADGKRNAQQIRDAVSAEYGPVPLELVVEYLKALTKIGVVAQKQ